MPAATTCPYCNALLRAAPGGRAPCPRCGETVAVPDADPAPVERVPYRKPFAANRRTAWAILGVMAAMAGTGLAYALFTVDTRRAHDKAIPRTSRRPVLPPLGHERETPPVPPARLAGLAYLPQGCTLVAGLHAAELLASPLGERLKAEPLRLGKAELSLDSVEKWLGIPAGNIDHLALGSVLEEGGVASLTPLSVLVVRCREPIGVLSLRRAIRAGSARQKGGKTVAEGKLGPLPVELWMPDPRTVVLGTDLRTLPARPADGLERLPAPLREAIEERLAGGTAAWVVAHSQDWTRTPFLGLAPALKALPLADRLQDVRTLAAWVPASRPLRVQAAIRAASPEAAQRLEAEAAKLPGLKHAREKEWLTLQRPIPETP